MKKTVSMWILAFAGLLTSVSGGCSLCCAPYDYCGPVFAEGRCSNLARFRCGTAFNQTYSTPQEGVMLDANGQPVPMQGPQNAAPQQGMPQPTPAPATSPLPAPTAAQNRMNYGAQQYRTASRTAASQTPSALPVPQNSGSVAAALPVSASETGSGTFAAENPQAGNIAVNADGYQKVAVYDENQQLMGYEIIDATGKSVQQLPAPAHVQ